MLYIIFLWVYKNKRILIKINKKICLRSYFLSNFATESKFHAQFITII